MNPQDPYGRTQPQSPQPPLGTPPSGYAVSPQPTNTPAPQAQPLSPEYSQPQQPQPLSTIQSNQPPTTYPSDYLDTIGVVEPQKTMSKFMIFGLIGGFIIAALLAVIMLSAIGKQPNFTEQSVIIKDRLDTLQSVVDEHQKHLVDNRLRVTNATMSSTLTTMSQELESITTARKMKIPKKPSEDEVAYKTKLQSTLNDSYLLGSLDRTYPNEMVYQISMLKTQLRKLKNQANSKQVVALYDNSLKSLDQISKEFSVFSGDK